jgi:pyruvate dehydrogenase E1 component alpha subunit
MSDPAKYRKEGELASFKTKDCIASCKDHLIALHGMVEDDFKEISKEIKASAKEAYAAAEASPEPDLAKLYDYTYVPTES